MAGAVIGDAVAGAVVGESVRRGLEMVDKALNFKTTREDLRDTLQHLTPLIQEMMVYDKTLDRPLDPIERVMKEFQESDKLVRKYSKVRWWKSLSLPFYHDRLQERDTKLVRSVTVDMQVHTSRDVKEILCTLTYLKEILLTLDNSIYGLNSNGKVMKGLCGAPENPEYTVGLDGALKNTKIELLKGGTSVLVLTGLPGSGKTTMAKKLCWDPDVVGNQPLKPLLQLLALFITSLPFIIGLIHHFF